MGKSLFTIALLSFCASVFGQGTVIFNNRVAGQVDAPVFRYGSTTEGAGPNAHAQLYLVTGQVYTPIVPATTFYDASVNPLLTRYIVSPGTIQVPGVLAGQQATLVMRVWEGGATFEEARSGMGSWWGETPPVTIILGGQVPGSPAIPDPALVGLQGPLLIPEPSTIALGILGAAALLYRRRK